MNTFRTFKSRFGKRNGGHPVYDAGEFLGGGSFVPMQAGFVGNVGGDNAALFEPMEKRKSAYMRFGKRKSAYMRFVFLCLTIYPVFFSI